MAGQTDPTLRFTDRVEDYILYRPGYPREILATLAAECGLTPASIVADIGCGPGNLAKIFLENGNKVIGVEPNAAMREAGVREFAGMDVRFQAVNGRAEETGLAPGSVDFVTAGQAFHWFEPEQARAEFLRILRPRGWCALVWNEHHRNSPFLNQYEQLLIRYGTDYATIRNKRNFALEMEKFFAPQPVSRREYAYKQDFGFDGLAGRLLSSSYAPRPPDPAHAPMLRGLRDIYDRYAEDGRVAFEYQTRLYYGRLS
jgi:SAM-dependent methyltransferase